MTTKIDFSKLREDRFSEKAYESSKVVCENVRNKSGFHNLQSCPICCEKLNHAEMFKYEVPIFLCAGCGVSFAGCHPNDFDDVYSTDDYLEQTLNAYDESRDYRKIRFGIERTNILKKYKEFGSLLDVGCGSGWFLEVAKEVYSVKGVEYSDSIRQWLKRQMGIMSVKTLGDLEEDFDIITAFDLIEHVPDPVGTLTKMGTLLKKDGVILIFTPNKDSLSFHITGEKNNLVCPPQHLFYFNKDSFEYLAGQAGLEIVFFETRGTDIGDIKSYYECWTDEPEWNASQPELVQNVIDSLGFSNHARYVLKKKDL